MTELRNVAPRSGCWFNAVWFLSDGGRAERRVRVEPRVSVGAGRGGRRLLGFLWSHFTFHRFVSSSFELSVQFCRVTSPCLSAGTTRGDELEGGKVIGLQYEAYEPMVQSEFTKLCADIRERWPSVKHICVRHRLGWDANANR